MNRNSPAVTLPGSTLPPPHPLPVRYLLAVIALLAGGLLAGPAAAQSSNGITLTAQAGLDSYCKYNHWLPVRVIVENTGPGLETTLQATLPGFGEADWHFTQAVSLPGVARKEITLYVFPQRGLNTVALSLNAEGKTLAKLSLPLTCVSETDAIYGVLAASPSIFGVLGEIDPPGGNAFVAQLETADLPEKAQGLDMLDVVVISGVDTGALNLAQQQALTRWVAGGGRLAVTGGADWQKTSAGLTGLLPFLPSRQYPAATTTLAGLSELQAFAGSSEPLEGEAVVATGLLAPEGELVASAGGAPVIARRKLGFGGVVFFAFDPALAPLRTWDGIADLYRAAIFWDADLPSWAGGFYDWSSAASAAGNIPGLGLPSFLWIFCFLGVYVLALGPVNYLVLYQMKRRELAWLTIPALVVVFTAIAIIAGNLLRGGRPVIHQVAVVQNWSDAPEARVDAVLALFSPNRRTYTLEIEDGGQFARQYPARQYPAATAHALPGGQFAASNPFMVEQISNGVRLPDLRLDVGGVKTAAAQGYVPALALTHDLIMRSSPTPGGTEIVLTGSLTNQTGLTFEKAVFLGPDDTFLEIGTFAPGQTQGIEYTFPFAQVNPATRALHNPFLSGSDNTASQVFGQDEYRRFSDEDVSRRYDLLDAVYWNYGAGSRGSQFYLVGWSREPVFGFGLGGPRFETEATTLYIFSLTPTLTRP